MAVSIPYNTVCKQNVSDSQPQPVHYLQHIWGYMWSLRDYRVSEPLTLPSNAWNSLGTEQWQL